MISESPSLRPLVQVEFDKRSQFSVCKCDRKTLVEYVTRWIQTHYNSSRYRFSGGASSEKRLHTQEVCPTCARKFSAENKLPLLPAPHPGPALGQKWKHWRSGEIMIIVDVQDHGMGPEFFFSPPIKDGYDFYDSFILHRFLSEFDPEEP